MNIPTRWRSNGAKIGWIAFAVLAVPIVVFMITVGISDGFTFGRVITAVIIFAIIGFTSWLLGYGISKGRIILVAIALLVLICILAAYAAAISLIVGGLHFRIF